MDVTKTITLETGLYKSTLDILMQHTSVGIRKAKIHVSKLLKMVQEGKEVILTDRGRPVGKIVPIQPETLELSDRIERLEAQDLLEPRFKNKEGNASADLSSR